LRATWDGDNPALAGLPQDAPACIAAERVHDEAFNREWEAIGSLFTTTPTTIAGIAALLDQLVVNPYSKEAEELGVDAGELVLEWALGDEDNREDAINLMTTLAAALRALDPATRPNGEVQSWHQPQQECRGFLHLGRGEIIAHRGTGRPPGAFWCCP
jgi:hypothetical protein